MTDFNMIKTEVDNAEQSYLKAYKEAESAVEICAATKKIWEDMKLTYDNLVEKHKDDVPAEKQERRKDDVKVA